MQYIDGDEEKTQVIDEASLVAQQGRAQDLDSGQPRKRQKKANPKNAKYSYVNLSSLDSSKADNMNIYAIVTNYSHPATTKGTGQCLQGWLADKTD